MKLSMLKKHIDAWLENPDVDPESEVIVEVMVSKNLVQLPLVNTDRREMLVANKKDSIAMVTFK